MELVKTKILNVDESLAFLQKRQKDGELGYEQQNTLTHLTAVAKLDPKDAAALEKELENLGFLNERQIVMLVNLVPKKEEEVKFILSQDKNSFTPDQLKQVLKTVKEHK